MSNRKPLTTIVEYPEIELSLKSFDILPELFQTRARLDPAVSKSYAEAKTKGSIFPAVLVFKTPEGRFLLADGFHRVDAWLRLGLKTIRACVRPGTEEEAILFGIEANFNHPAARAVTLEDRKQAVTLMIRNEEFRRWGDKRIGTTCGINPQAVAKLRVELADKENIDIPTHVVKFIGGKPSNETTPYRRRRHAPPVKQQISGRCVVRVDGNVIYRGRNLEKAESKQAESLAEREFSIGFLSSTSRFLGFLTRNLIAAECGGTHGLGGVFTRSAIFFPAGDSEYHAVLQVVARAVLSGVEEAKGRRLIAVGFFVKPFSNIGRVISLCSQLSPPVEFMTPDEVVAEFGPKDEVAA